jgi:hypothetical protein
MSFSDQTHLHTVSPSLLHRTIGMSKLLLFVFKTKDSINGLVHFCRLCSIYSKFSYINPITDYPLIIINKIFGVC